ncbi:MAG: ABC transporter substrate-binding protein [Anaerolineaceae bacterium]|nr:ABC transporter substrate-binding protein [Anaerolineaceae bacterium]
MKQRIFILVLLMFVLVFGTAQAQEPQSGGVLRAAWQSKWESLDPHVASSEATFQILNNVLETLTFFDDDMNLIPWLAESWERSDDGLTWTFHLRQGVMFSNGREMTAADVKWSLDRLVNPDTASGNAWRIGGASTTITAVDNYTVAITTESPSATMPASIAANKSIGIMAPESLNDEGLVDVPIGTGPFLIAAVEGTTSLRLERNPDYWQEGLPYLDAVEITPITDDATRELALKGGEVDWIFTIAPQNLAELQADEDVVVETSPRLSYDYIGLNLTKEPFSDVRVRQAMAYSLDRQVVCDFAFFGLCEPVQGPTASGTAWYFPYSPYDQDIAKAKALMEEAGYGDGFAMVINPVIGFEETIRGAQVLEQMFSEIGITVTIEPEEAAVIIEKEGNGQFDAIMWSWIGLTDAEDYFYLQHRTGQGLNFTGFSNPEFDALVDEGRTLDDFAARYAVYEQANQILVDEAPYIYLYAKSEVKAWAPYVQGYAVRPDSANNFWTVWLDNQ